MSVSKLSNFSNSSLFAIRDAVLSPDLSRNNVEQIVRYNGLELLCGTVQHLFFLLDLTHRKTTVSLVYFETSMTIKKVGALSDPKNPVVKYLNQSVELGKEPPSLEVLKLTLLS